MRRLSAVLLSLCLMLSLTAPVLAAPQTSGAASTLRLESTEGTVQMKDAAGKAIKANKGTRLYNGYSLSTQKASYAFVSLDSSKAVKLDASTTATVFQSGKKLELTASSGQLFFNVTAPLKSDESLTIRTSTMVTGVRGTCGWVEISDRNTTRISLLEGTLTVTSPDPVTGENRTITIQGGQTLTIVYEGDGHGFDPSLIGDNITIQDLIDQGIINENNIILTGTGLTVEILQEDRVPGFVAVEVAKDKALQKKIEETTNLSVPDIIRDAKERLAAEEAAAELQDQKIQEALENLSTNEAAPLFESSTESSGASGGGGGGAAPAPVRGVVNSTSDTTAALNEELRQAAADGNDVVVSNPVSGNDQTTVVVQQGQTMTLAQGASLDGGTYDVQGTLTVEPGATVTNAGALINVNSTNSLEISGTLINSGVIIVGETTDGALRILSGGELITEDGTLYVGPYDSAGASGLLEIAEGGTLSSEVMIREESTLTNNGTINGFVTNYGELTNNGIINGILTNQGTTNHYGTLSFDTSAPINMQGGTLNITNAKVESLGYADELGTGIPAIEVWSDSGTINISNSTITATGEAISDGTGTAICTIHIKDNSSVIGLQGGIDEAFAESTIVEDGCTVGTGEGLTTYTVTFHGNAADASHQSATETFTSGISQILCPYVGANVVEITRPGYTQAGWNTEPDGSGTAYAMNQSFTATKDIDLYAQWKINSFTVHFVLNGGSGAELPEPVSVDYGDSVTMPDIQLTKENAHFIGWAETQTITLSPSIPANATVIYRPGETTDDLFAPDGEEIFLYAAWADYKIEYNANTPDAIGEMAPSYHSDSRQDASIHYTEVGFTREGWVINKWTLDPEGNYGTGTAQYANVSEFKELLASKNDGDDTIPSVITLYAQWEPITP